MWHYNGRRFSTDTIKKYYRRMNLYKIWYLLVVVCIMKVLLINCFVQIVLFTYSPCSNLHRPQSPCYSFENSFFPTLKPSCVALYIFWFPWVWVTSFGSHLNSWNICILRQWFLLARYLHCYWKAHPG